MSSYPYDEESLRKSLMTAIAGVFLDGINSETPMQEIRERARAAGAMYGRAYAACLHDGPITSELVLSMRHAEQVGIQSFERSVGATFGPGGEIRRLWSEDEA